MTPEERQIVYERMFVRPPQFIKTMLAACLFMTWIFIAGFLITIFAILTLPIWLLNNKKFDDSQPHKWLWSARFPRWLERWIL